MRQRVQDDIHAHFERGLALVRRVVVDVGVGANWLEAK